MPPRRLSTTTVLLEGTLLLVAIVGVFYAWPVQREARQLAERRSRLELRVGAFQIVDPRRLHARLLPARKPQELRWRVSLPAGQLARIVAAEQGRNISTGYLSTATEPREGTVTVSWRESADGLVLLEIAWRFPNSGGVNRFSVGSAELAEVLKRGDVATWSVVGRDDIESFAVDEVFCLLGISSSDASSAAGARPAALQINVGTTKDVTTGGAP